MKILFIGYSSIVKRRVLPAVLNLPQITKISVASKSRADSITFPAGYDGQIFDDYETALAESEADLVYISTVNSDHAPWTKKALQHGLHTIVDKPAFLSLQTTEQLLNLAQQKNLCLAESTVYSYHPQIKVIKQAFSSVNSHPTHITASFSFPPLPKDNFRYQKKLGGGVLWDLGPYAVSTGRLFFETEPEEIACYINQQNEAVEIAFSLLVKYNNNRFMVGHFGCNTGYRNHLEVLGPSVTVNVDRIFTTPPTMENIVHINQHNQPSTKTVLAADTFTLFMKAVIDALETKNYTSFAEAMLSDARVLNHLRQSAGK